MFWNVRINHILQWNDKEEALYAFKKIFIFLQVPALFALNIIYKTWGFLLRNRHQTFLSRRKPELFVKLMPGKGVLLDNSWGFGDDTDRLPCRTEKSLIVLHIFVYYCNKFQPVLAANGLSKLVWSRFCFLKKLDQHSSWIFRYFSRPRISTNNLT